MKHIIFFFTILFSTTVLIIPNHVFSAPLNDAYQKPIKAVVRTVIESKKGFSEVTLSVETMQIIEAEILEGEQKGEKVIIHNDYISLKKNQHFFMGKYVDHTTGEYIYTVSEPNRIPSILFFLGIFLAVLFIFGGKQGLRGLVSLILSLVLILFVLIPLMLKGYSPVFVALGVASLIIVIASYVTHGFNRTTTAAVLGMLGAVCITGILAYIAIHTTHISGFASEDAVFLKSISQNLFNIQGLLLAGILIGLLGVLYDAAISQAIIIEELIHASPNMSLADLYKRGIRVGREHIGALVDTLAIAYVGASLPLLLLVMYANTSEPLLITLNREIFATEIIRTLIGSIGLILAVPMTTYVSVYFLKKVSPKREPGSKHHSHSHFH